MDRSGTLKLIFIPWGSLDFGDDLWLIENAAVFCIEFVLDLLPPAGSAQYADMYAQLGGDKVRSGPVAAYTDAQIRQLSERAPADVDAIIDGMISDVRRDPDTDALVSVLLAPRVFLRDSGQFALPDAFVFDGFDHGHRQGRDASAIDDVDGFFAMMAALSEAALAPLGVQMPGDIDGERLQVTRSWEAFAHFIKAKRQARTVDEKRGYYRQAIKADPHFYWALYNEAQILKSRRDFATARRLFMEAVHAAKGDPALLGDTYFEIGLCSVSLGDPKTARNFWDQALTYAPENPTLLINIAGTYEQEASFTHAIALHRKVLQIEPDNHKALISLGRLEATLGNLDEAIGCYARALALRPDDPLRHAILGGCYLARGDREQAREHLQAASDLDPPRAKLAPVAGSDPLDDATPPPGEYARQELAKIAEFAAANEKKRRRPLSLASFGRTKRTDKL